MYDVESLLAEPLLAAPLKRAVHEGAPPTYLRSVKIKLTARCNLRCVMCKYGRSLNYPELGTDAFVRIVRELAAFGCRKVHFSGGEVLARNDFEVIATAAAEAALKVTLTSNLTLLTRDRAKALMRIKVSSISTSLDGANRKTHDAIRGIPGSFKRTTRAIENLAKERARRGRGTRLRVNYVMMRQNAHEYPALVRLAHSLGVTELHPMPVDAKGSANHRLARRHIDHYNTHIAPEVLQARQEAGFSVDERMIYPFGRAKGCIDESVVGDYAQGYYREHLCFSPWSHMFVAWDGKVYLCCMTNGRIDALGDLSHESVRDVFQGEKFQTLRERFVHQRLPDCHRCDMFLDENKQLSAAIGEPRMRGLLRVIA